MAGMACGTVAVFLVLDLLGRARDLGYQAEVRALVPSLYSMGLVLYGSAAALYAPLVAEKTHSLVWWLAGVSMPAGTAAAWGYWGYGKRPGKGTGLALTLGHLTVLLSNAVAREAVRFCDLGRWVDPERLPVRGEWGGVFLFALMVIVASVPLGWIAATALRTAR